MERRAQLTNGTRMQPGRWLLGLAFLTALGGPSTALATAQQGDRLVIDGRKLWIQVNPLEPYLEENPDSLPKSDIMFTGLWRGYVATWEIEEGRLYLIDVEIYRAKPDAERSDPELYSVMSELFPDRERVPAEWFTGHLIAPQGELVDYVHMGYASTYERYIIFTVVDGRLEMEREMKLRAFRKFRKAQFEAFEQTEEYRAAFDRLHGRGDDPDRTRSFLFDFYGAEYMATIYEDGE